MIEAGSQEARAEWEKTHTDLERRVADQFFKNR